MCAELSHARGNDQDELTVDSGAYVHAAPPDYGRHFELGPMARDVHVCTVTGKQWRIHGLRKMKYLLECDDGRQIPLRIGFVACKLQEAQIRQRNKSENKLTTN